MDNLYDLIYDFIVTHIFPTFTATGSQDWALSDFEIELQNGMSINMQQWICHTYTIISITFILVLCCLFVYKIIKLIGGLIR